MWDCVWILGVYDLFKTLVVSNFEIWVEFYETMWETYSLW
jgi:hypothetical protein